MLIGRLAEESGFSKDTIRYYEKLGLIEIEKIDRHANNYKNYPVRTLQRLSQISELKAAGFTLTEIVSILVDFNHLDRPCANLPAKLDEKIGKLNSKILLLENCKQVLFEIRKTCNGECGTHNGLPSCISPQ